MMHRDLKPDNCLIYMSASGQMLLRVGDVGLAKRHSDAPNTPAMCTWWYRGPEMLAHLQYDFRDDIWSFGCTFVELLSGSPAFPGNRRYKCVV